MIEILLLYILPTLFFIGFGGLFIKPYLNFKYYKIVYSYPHDLKYFQFINSFKYLTDNIWTVLPFFLKNNLETLTDEKQLICRKLEKHIFICLTMLYIGMATIPIGIKLQEYYHILPN